MRNILGIMGVLVLVAGCDKPPTKIGTECGGDGDCNVTGQKCVTGICTRACQGDFGDQGCPVGFTCNIGDAAAGFTCNKTKFAVDDKGQPVMFGLSCALNGNVCGGTADPNPTAQCRKAAVNPTAVPPVPLASDPNAFCTAACTADSDCPIRMYCAADYDGVKKCLFRERCSACELNDNCPKDWVCAAIDGGKAKYCTTICGGQGDCPGAPQMINYLVCKDDTDVQGNIVKVCAHRYGACVGNGEACDPCRAQTDCKSGLKCFFNDATGERFCSKQCTGNGECASPNKVACNMIQTNFNLCTGENAGDLLTCWP